MREHRDDQDSSERPHQEKRQSPPRPQTESRHEGNLVLKPKQGRFVVAFGALLMVLGMTLPLFNLEVLYESLSVAMEKGERYLFSADLKLITPLDQGELPPSLEEKFQTNKRALSPHRTLRVIKEGEKWEITDQKKKYTLEKEALGLNVYGEEGALTPEKVKAKEELKAALKEWKENYSFALSGWTLLSMVSRGIDRIDGSLEEERGKRKWIKSTYIWKGEPVHVSQKDKVTFLSLLKALLTTLKDFMLLCFVVPILILLTFALVRFGDFPWPVLGIAGFIASIATPMAIIVPFTLAALGGGAFFSIFLPSILFYPLGSALMGIGVLMCFRETTWWKIVLLNLGLLFVAPILFGLSFISFLKYLG